MKPSGYVLLIPLLLGTQRHQPARSTQEMIRELAEIMQSTPPGRNPYDNARRAEELAGLPGIQDRARFAIELLHAGESARAAELFREMLESSDPALANDRFRQLLHSFLAISHLRLGEQDNCILAHHGNACLFPIRGNGVHRLERGSRAAIDVYDEILRERPERLAEKWLLNLAHMTLGEYPDGVPEAWRIAPETFDSDFDIGRFPNRAPGLGLDVLGLAGGSILEDFDRDGFLDVMASSWGLEDQIRYFENDGDGTFTDRTEEARLSGLGGGLNLVQADYDNDGFIDVLVLRGAWLGPSGVHPNSLLRNRGDGTFEDVTVEAGIATRHPTQTAAWGDYDNDGWLDLFIGNESLGDDVHPSELYRNNGDGSFTNEGPGGSMGYVKAVSWGDYDNDGFLDLYVSRLGLPNMLIENQGPDSSGRVRFAEATRRAGVGEPVISFPAWFWDFDNDGWLDIWVSGYGASKDPRRFGSAVGDDAEHVAADYLGLPTPAETPRLYRNRGDGTFEDLTQAARLDTVLFTMGSNFGDLDNDGYLDFYAGTGSPDFRSLIPNRMFRNSGDGHFQDVTTSGGFGHLQKGHGIAFGDIDNDGDQDIYAVMGGSFSGDVYQNALFVNPGHRKRWITLRLAASRANRDAVGARITVTIEENGAERRIFATAGSGGSFGASSLQQEIGLGDASRIKALEIRWPGTGAVDHFWSLPLDRVVLIQEGYSTPVVIDP